MQRIFLWALIAIVAIAPLPFGSNRPLAWSLLSFAVGFVLVCWSIHHLWANQPLPVSVKRIRVPLVLFVLTCLWVCVQLIPNIPFGLAHPAWQEANIFFGSSAPQRITIDPDRTVMSVMRWLAYAGVFWLSLQLGRDRVAARTAILAFSIVSAAYALYGMIALFGLEDTILGYDKWAGQGTLTSTFVNRNSYATFVGLGIIVVMALFIGSRSGRSDVVPFSAAYWRELLANGRTANAYLYAAFFLLFSALLLTGSRAGALSTCGGILVLLWLLVLKKRGRSQSPPIKLTAFLVFATAIIGFSGGLLGERFMQSNGQQRIEVYEQTLSAIKDHAMLGSGAGSFPQLFPLYRETEVLRDKIVIKAHNTYLESALELGLPAMVCLTLAIGWLAWLCWRGVRNRSRDRHYAATGLAASVLVGSHALVDFSFQVPAVVVAYMFIMGVAVAQSFSSRRA